MAQGCWLEEPEHGILNTSMGWKWNQELDFVCTMFGMLVRHQAGDDESRVQERGLGHRSKWESSV